MSKTAIVLGATGLTGGILVDKLLADEAITEIKLFSRNASGRRNLKIKEYIIDLFELEKSAANFKADIVFCCIGTTKTKTPDKEMYRKIDYGIPVAASELCKKNGINTFIVVSAMGADPKSKVFYNKTKGEMERDLLLSEIPNTYILQPSLIGGYRSEARIGERFAKNVMGSFDFLIPSKYKMIHPESIAKAMLWLSKNDFSEKIISSENIKEIALR
jgi:uncharacterized protein YbjT (DUF2867 family)